MKYNPPNSQAAEVNTALEFYTEEEAVALMRLETRATLKTLIKTGRIPKPIRLTRVHVLFPKDQLDQALLDLQKQ